MSGRKELLDRLHVREKSHKKLDELLDMYEAGFPLWLRNGIGWESTRHPGAKLEIVIKDNQ